MIDNFGRLNFYLDFKEGYYYYLQILRRKKDNPDAKHVKVIRNFYIENKDYYNDIQDTVKNMCKLFNARAYLRLNIRSWEKTAYHMLREVAKNMSYRQFKPTRNAFDKASGRYNDQDPKLWLIDMDGDHTQKHNRIVSTIRELQEDIQKDYNVWGTIPTPNGNHLITNPFNLKEFSDKFPDIDVHKDNPTILYTP